MEFNPTYGIVTSEGCDIHYWYQGTGPLLTFVPGGNGHGRQYNPIMAALSGRFTCCTFDRRQMSASKTRDGKNRLLSFPQQARDLLAVIRAAGFERSALFCSSLGGLIGYQFALDHPRALDRLVCHEAPVLALLPDASRWQDFVVGLAGRYREARDVAAVAGDWAAALGGIYEAEPGPGARRMAASEPENQANFWENEALGSFYTPDFRRILAAGVRVGVMDGDGSGDAFYARSVYEQEEVLGCLRMTVPGHHQGFEAEVERFVPALLEMLDRLEERRGAAA